jgi:hypothetical protein
MSQEIVSNEPYAEVKEMLFRDNSTQLSKENVDVNNRNLSNANLLLPMNVGHTKRMYLSAFDTDFLVVRNVGKLSIYEDIFGTPVYVKIAGVKGVVSSVNYNHSYEIGIIEDVRIEEGSYNQAPAEQFKLVSEQNGSEFTIAIKKSNQDGVFVDADKTTVSGLSKTTAMSLMSTPAEFLKHIDRYTGVEPFKSRAKRLVDLTEKLPVSFGETNLTVKPEIIYNTESHLTTTSVFPYIVFWQSAEISSNDMWNYTYHADEYFAKLNILKLEISDLGSGIDEKEAVEYIDSIIDGADLFKPLVEKLNVKNEEAIAKRDWFLAEVTMSMQYLLDTSIDIHNGAKVG